MPQTSPWRFACSRLALVPRRGLACRAGDDDAGETVGSARADVMDKHGFSVRKHESFAWPRATRELDNKRLAALIAGDDDDPVRLHDGRSGQCERCLRCRRAARAISSLRQRLSRVSKTSLISKTPMPIAATLTPPRIPSWIDDIG
jgi:hypothetical protein